ncbi:Arylsulfatase [Dyadobacter sp. CECT 9275]|uniref:Arylsulfatase n=1 Tax=Dyadobacter helix TaxID=2822344 RepID=A0A916JIV8_9BACT|nr:sulfatase-like hydrolase/transferase [Dyadobacter sp. CECT 9275]CAG5018806.1 Arylsulfatase [Dyadobacter sp. CECT 9275]
MTRKKWNAPTAVVLSFAAICLMAATREPVVVEKLPNILLILTDDQGYHDVGYYGTKDLRTPHIDQIAKNGIRFDNFYANCPVCSPTRAALLTGNYPDVVGVPGVIRTYPEDNWGYLSPKGPLLPAMLRKKGYHTAIIGKWHLGLESPNTPNERGFEYFHGWLGDMMDDYWAHRRHDINYMRENEKVIDPKGHATDLFTQWSQDYIKKQAKSKRPFFLYLAYNAPHTPVQPPQEWLEKVRKREPGIDEKRARLVALIEHMDDGIGKVTQTLKEEGLYENTLIIYSSDNGGHLPSMANNGALRDGKQSMYEGGLRVPTCMSWPARIQAGRISVQPNVSMDLYPTLLQLVRLEAKGEDGRSFLPTLMNADAQEKQEERELYFTRREGGMDYAGMSSYCLRKGKWKLVKNAPHKPMELFDMENDKAEKHNVIAENPEVYKELNKLLMRHIQEGGRVPWQKPH